MIERRICPGGRRRGGEPAFMLGEGVGVERVLARQVLRMHEGLRGGDAGAERRARLPRFALALVSMAGRGEIGLRQLRPFRPLTLGDAPSEPDPIGARRRAEHPREACASEPGERIVADALLKRGDGANGGVEQRDLARKDVAEEAGNAQCRVDPRPAQHRQRQHLEAADAVRRRVPGRTAADERESLREIVAAGAHGRRAPEVDDDPLRPVAVVLRMAGQHLLGRAPPDLPGVAGRGRARIDGVEIAPGRQHVEAPPRRRAGRSGGDEASAERPDEPEQFGGAAGGHALGQRRARGRVSIDAGEAVGAVGRAAEHMQAVADPHVLEVAEPGVESERAPLPAASPRPRIP